MNPCRNILLHLGQNVTKTEIPKGSPLWQGVQGDRVPLLKFPVTALKNDFRENRSTLLTNRHKKGIIYILNKWEYGDGTAETSEVRYQTPN